MPGCTLRVIYRRLFSAFGPQCWWPARTGFEVIVGAILTQNTNWGNVEKAIAQLKKNRALSASRMRAIAVPRLARLIRSAGYYRVKADRLKQFLRFFFGAYGGSLKKMSSVPVAKLRGELLSVKGIGPETADSILLYALGKPVFVVDAYTKRILSRHRLIREGASYDQVQEFCLRNLPRDAGLFNECHALLVRLGKEFCLKRRPRCNACPVRSR